MKTDYLKRYREYLKSLHWAQLKIQSAKAWGDGCYVCGSVPVDFHHLAYRNLVDCTPDDVIPLCRGCHSGAHFKGGMFRRIKALRDNNEKRRLLREQLTRGLAEWRNRCTEAVSDWGGYLMRTGKKAEIERSKAAGLAAKIKRHGEWAVLTPEGQLAQSRKKLERAIRLGMARDIIRKRQGKVRHLEALVAALKQNPTPGLPTWGPSVPAPGFRA